jgi:hypothetical protein
MLVGCSFVVVEKLLLYCIMTYRERLPANMVQVRCCWYFTIFL